MGKEIVKNIVTEAFQKAKKECPGDSKHAWSEHISLELINGPSKKTLIRTYEFYTSGGVKGIKASTQTVQKLCEYLGYPDYVAYVEKNSAKNEPIPPPNLIKNTPATPQEKQPAPGQIWKFIGIAGFLIITVSVFFLFNAENPATETSDSCMTWAETHYEITPCTTAYSQYGTRVEPYNKERLNTFKKVAVTPTTSFFVEGTTKPLIWYYKTREGTLEFFTAPGLHPVNGETLRKITPHMIQKYVPIHQVNEDSYVQENGE